MPAGVDTKSHIYLAEPDLLQVITHLGQSCPAGKYIFQKHQNPAALLSSRPRAFFNKSHPQKVESRVVFCFWSISDLLFSGFFFIPEGSQGHGPGLVLLLSGGKDMKNVTSPRGMAGSGGQDWTGKGRDPPSRRKPLGEAGFWKGISAELLNPSSPHGSSARYSICAL